MDRLVPPGTIVSFGGGTVPAGWLKCDGRVVSSKTYPRLYAAIGTSWGAGYTRTYTTNEEDGSITVEDIKGNGDFNLPDLRGVFLRGVNGDRADSFVDSDNGSRTNLVNGGALGNAVGSYQKDEFKEHTHLFAGDDYIVYQNQRVNYWAYDAKSEFSGYGGIYKTNMDPDSPGGNETRPVNAYVNYIIKY